MKCAVTLILVASLTMTARVCVASSADRVLTNASIYGYPSADSIAIANGKILYVGSQEDMNSLQSSATETIDLDGGFVVPGFIDNHNHVFEAASEAGGQCELGMDAGLEAQISYLKACRKDARRGEWVMGYGFSIEALLAEENKRTPLEVIDSVFPDQPVIIMEQTSHSMWVNSVALSIAGINKHSPDPQGGKILKDEGTGELNGILLDNAGDIVMEIAWNSLEEQFDQSYEGMMAGLDEARRHGITTIGDGRLYWKRGWYEVWKEAEKRGDLTARISLRPWIYPTDSMQSQLAFLSKVLTTDKSRLLLVDQVKMYSDGILVNGSAKTLDPYLDTYIPDEPYGINYIPPEAMEEWLKALDKIGYGAHIHAIGDGAIRESLNAIEAMRQQGGAKDYTLTHVELVNSKDVERFAKLNVTADFQVGSDYVAYHDHQWAEAFLGAKRTRALMNLKAIFDTGANVSLSSDWNVHDINPLVGIGNSLIMGKTGLPSVEDAIDAYTINAAVSLGIDDVTGSIEVGKAADFAILSRDITKLSAEKIKQTDIWMTMLNGQIVYSIDE
ncbi:MULTISPECIES: amidohydrolase [Vibrio]|uniref:amidohydrolase n=1 Tax=Vibrio TaxID=662 RepID=UPI002076481A|nr:MULTISPECIES: amidohydrolase [Vibrio]USD35053.1 amidohydrolase [Vibrio sp. SCSIO 43186]USD48118.1 amidohydrolase [Vibrio sp. SCSIO 43145]USD72178.1 amidohydrolase [Vibrio sp. SCSIO 43139]USD97850.1 urease [Vibrio coralliilyticus]